MILRFAPAVSALTLLAACAGGPALTPGQHLKVTTDTELPPPTGADIAAVSRDYHVAPFDQLKINVFGVEELNQTIRADAGGNIALPLIGRVSSAGLTLAELNAQLTQRLSRYIRHPQVSVNLEDTTSQVVTVYGEVRDPGLFPITGEMTLLRAVARSKGLTDLGSVQDVIVYRTVGNQKMAALYNLDAIKRGAYPDPKLYANDVVVVGDSPGRALFKSILAASPLLITPIIVLLQRL